MAPVRKGKDAALRHHAFAYTKAPPAAVSLRFPRYRRLDMPTIPIGVVATGPETKQQRREYVADMIKISRSPCTGRYSKKPCILSLFLGMAGFTIKL